MDARELYVAIFDRALTELGTTQLDAGDRLRLAGVQASAAIVCLTDAAKMPLPVERTRLVRPLEHYNSFVREAKVRNVVVGEREHNAEPEVAS